MTDITHTSSQHHKTDFDTDGVSIGIDNHYYFTMSHFNQDFVGPPRKGRRVINIFEVPKVKIIYEGTIDWTINENSGHPNWV